MRDYTGFAWACGSSRERPISIRQPEPGRTRAATVCSGLVKLGDDVGYGVADARDFTQPIFYDDLLEGHRQGE